MIEIYIENGGFVSKKDKNFDSLQKSLRDYSSKINKIPNFAIIKILDALGRKIIRDPELMSEEGMLFLAKWLSVENLSSCLELSINNLNYINSFSKPNSVKETSESLMVKAQPRGLVCHWIAGNVPTLAIFSLVQSLMVRNTNIVRVPKSSIDVILKILKSLQKLEIVFEDSVYNGRQLLGSFSIVYFDSTDQVHNNQLSSVADMKVIWGGEDAVNSIKKMPEMVHCETVVFGPKYSFGVIDAKSIESKNFEKNLYKAVLDVILFEQTACSSPHVLFFEKSNRDIDSIVGAIKNHFENLSMKYPKIDQSEFLSSKIVNERYKYLLEPSFGIEKSDFNDWSILINDEFRLEHPVQGRTIFVKEIANLADVENLITRKVQTVGMMIADTERKKQLSDSFTSKGALRCVNFGNMHSFDIPWDGMFFISRLVRWCQMEC